MRINANLASVEAMTSKGNGSGGGWHVWPDGWYRMMITNSEYKKTSAGDGMCLHVTHTCLDQNSEFSGDTLMEFLTLEHPKPKVVKISHERLKALAEAIGVPNSNHVVDSKELHNKPFEVRLYSRPAKDSARGDASGLEQMFAEYRPAARSASRAVAEADAILNDDAAF